MDYGRLRHQTQLKCDCIECGGNRTFTSIGADPDSGIAYFQCDAPDCDHTIELHLAP